jgi:tetratricopeptide (TPR) repeat protein
MFVRDDMDRVLFMKQIKPGVVLVIGMLLLYPLQRWTDGAAAGETRTDETLYFSSGQTIRKMSLGLEGLTADIYWIRTLQYFGRKLIDSGKPLSSSMTADIDMPLLAPLLNIVVTLDPHNLPAYRFGAIFLPERDIPAAIALLEKGIRENPNEWRLYQDLAYIYWQEGNSATKEEQAALYEKAAHWYELGGQIPGSLWWMRDLAGLMRIKGGSRDAARLVYQAYLTSDDKNISAQAVERLKQLQSLDELDVINSVLAKWRQSNGHCPADLRAIAPSLRSAGILLDDDSMPIDPDGFSYVFDAVNCEGKLAMRSSIPR